MGSRRKNGKVGLTHINNKITKKFLIRKGVSYIASNTKFLNLQFLTPLMCLCVYVEILLLFQDFKPHIFSFITIVKKKGGHSPEQFTLDILWGLHSPVIFRNSKLIRIALTPFRVFNCLHTFV